MGFSLQNVVPWGRSYSEYIQMFSLTEMDLRKRILGCGDGPAAFNVELTQRGGHVVSLDPLYQFSSSDISKRITETYHDVIAQLVVNDEDYVWDTIPSVEALGEMRMGAMELFLGDFEKGKECGRYITEELPVLSLADDAFDMALSSHFLFLYSAHFSVDFHIESVMELLRVSKEVRVFPLLTLDGKPTPHLDAVLSALGAKGYDYEIKDVNYEFQKGGRQMLVAAR